ncbi:hypothetical protein [Acinetobacter phage Ab69]|nr:hypothetical protein [Acinetobacter phage Ab69]
MTNVLAVADKVLSKRSSKIFCSSSVRFFAFIV